MVTWTSADGNNFTKRTGQTQKGLLQLLWQQDLLMFSGYHWKETKKHTQHWKGDMVVRVNEDSSHKTGSRGSSSGQLGQTAPTAITPRTQRRFIHHAAENSPWRPVLERSGAGLVAAAAAAAGGAAAAGWGWAVQREERAAAGWEGPVAEASWTVERW